jgi:hypothetical protein
VTEHVEVRVIGRPAAVDAFLRLLRALDHSQASGGGARGPYPRDGGRVAYYAHLQVVLAPPGQRPPAVPGA